MYVGFTNESIFHAWTDESTKNSDGKYLFGTMYKHKYYHVQLPNIRLQGAFVAKKKKVYENCNVRYNLPPQNK